MPLRHVLLPLVAAGVTVTAAVAADKDAKGIVAVRQNVMDAQASHMNAIKAILTEDPQAINLVAAQAMSIADTTATIPDMFPKGSDQPPGASANDKPSTPPSHSQARCGINGAGTRWSSGPAPRRQSRKW